MKKILSMLVAAAISGTFSACMDVPPLPQEVERGDFTAAGRHATEVALRNMRKSGVTGLSMALVDEKIVPWAAGFGWADQKNRTGAGPETVYLAGSVTKLFTAAAVMQLYEKGLIDIDRPFAEYMPDFKIRSRFPDARPFTVREVLTHHAGLPGTWLKGAFVEKPDPPDSILGSMPDAFMAYPPGTIYDYSNLGYAMLGALISKVSGKDYASYVEAEILRPLGMKSSSFTVRDDMRKFLSKPCKDGKPAVEFPIRDIAAGGLHTSVLDLALFMQAMLAGGGKILKPDTVAEMLKPQNAGVPLDMDLKIGLAWHLYDPGELSYAGRTAFHDGATLHYQTTFVMLPDHRLGVVAMSNSPGSKTLMYRASTDALKIMLQAKAGIKPPPPPTTPPDAESPPPAAALKAVEGNYATSFGNVRITARQDRLDAEISGHRARLVPLEGGGFRPEIRFMGFTVRIKELDGVTAHFTKVAGLDSMIGKTQGGTFLAGTKTDRVPIPEAWSRRVGRYMLANRDGDQLYIDDVAVSVDDGSLTMEFSLPGITHERAKFILLPCSDTEAVTAGYGRYMGETVNVISTGNSESLHYSGFIFKRD